MMTIDITSSKTLGLSGDLADTLTGACQICDILAKNVKPLPKPHTNPNWGKCCKMSQSWKTRKDQLSKTQETKATGKLEDVGFWTRSQNRKCM